MTGQLGFRPEAQTEALEARRWYEGRRAGLGAEFGEALGEIIARIVDTPLAFPRVRGETRPAVLGRFPYAVYFRIVGEDIVVLAVHSRQHPRRWQSRTR